ncbi:ComEC/Rec2 family competence protein [Pseudorhizobium pelagicum]|uniref:ComEC/Rec2 family competence protein n=1 Tax=Pseudorhizobium pelagicum TaxID=1509405 RepID=UPI0009DDCEA4|nr:ComEC/Rec2 family competence protein [Pseudorhizobium pelagicum]
MPQESVLLENWEADEAPSLREANGLLPVPQAPATDLADTQLDGVDRWAATRKRWRVDLARDRFVLRLTAMVEEERAHGHMFLFCPVLIGIGAMGWFSSPVDPPAVAILACLGVFTLVVIIARARSGILPLVPLTLALLLAGAGLAQVETWRRSTLLLDSPVTTLVTGEVERREAAGPRRWRYIIRLAATADPVIRRPPEQVVLLARSRHVPFEAGEWISGRARLSPPSGPALPGLNDFAFSAYFDGIGAVGFFYGAPVRSAEPQLPAGASAGGLERRIFALRGAIAERIRAIVPGDAGAFAAAIVTDERRAISQETTEALRISGLAHIVAISGLNMALAAGIFFVGLRTVLGWFTGFAQAWPVKKIAAFGALLMATAYYLISGFAISAERAYLMMSVMLIAVFFDRMAISLRNVAISALVILAMSPSEILGPSFQMSFAATVALVAGYAVWSRRAADAEATFFPPLKGHWAAATTGWHFMAGIFVTSLIGGLSTAIYSMEHFHRLAGYGLAANLAVMPIISFIVMPAGLVGMLLMPFGLDAPFLTLMGHGLAAVIAVANHVAAWGGDVPVGRQHPWFLAIASAGFLLLALLRTRLRLLGLPLLVLAFLLSWHEQRKPPADLLVAEDGALVALLGPVIATNRARPPDFIFDQWQRALRLEQPLAPKVSPSGDIAAILVSDPPDRLPLDPDQLAQVRTAMREMARAADEKRGIFHCLPKAWCLAVTTEGALVAVMDDGRLTGIGCDVAAVVVAPRARFDECRSGAFLISGRTLRKTGALEIRLNGSREPGRWHATAAMSGSDRPWNRHRHYDWRSDSFDATVPESVSALLSGSGG